MGIGLDSIEVGGWRLEVGGRGTVIHEDTEGDRRRWRKEEGSGGGTPDGGFD